MGVTTVALYDTLGADAQRYVIDQTELTTIVCSDDLVDKILAIKQADDHLEEDQKKVHRLKNLVVMEPYDPNKPANPDFKIPAELGSKADSCGIKLHTFQEVINKGKEKLAEF